MRLHRVVPSYFLQLNIDQISMHPEEGSPLLIDTSDDISLTCFQTNFISACSFFPRLAQRACRLLDINTSAFSSSLLSHSVASPHGTMDVIIYLILKRKSLYFLCSFKVLSSFCQPDFTVMDTCALLARLFDCCLLPYVKCKCQSNFPPAYLHDNKLSWR